MFTWVYMIINNPQYKISTDILCKQLITLDSLTQYTSQTLALVNFLFCIHCGNLRTLYFYTILEQLYLTSCSVNVK